MTGWKAGMKLSWSIRKTKKENLYQEWRESIKLIRQS